MTCARLVSLTPPAEVQRLLAEVAIKNRPYRVYKRGMHTEMAEFLRTLVNEYRETGDWVHSRTMIPAAPKASSDTSYADAWGLVRKRPKKRGWYKPTFLGCLFVDNQLLVPSHAFIDNNRRTCLGFMCDLVSIRDVLETPFDRDDLTDSSTRNGDPL